MPAWLTPSHPRFELVLAGLMVVVVAVEMAILGLLTPLGVLVAAGVALPVAVRFRWPVTAVALTGLAGVVMYGEIDREGDLVMPLVCLLLCLYAVGSRGTVWQLVAGGGVAMGALAAGMLVVEGVTSDLVLAFLLPVAGLLIGRASGVLLLETEVLELERDEQIQQAIHSERSRIAREMHDVIGHSISVMGLQAGAVRSVLPEEQVREREALLGVEQTGRDAVGEMRRLIGLLREGEEPPDALSPSLARVDALAAEMRAAGQTLSLTVDGDLGELPPGVDLAAYRIVQEALTNALNHAPGAPVTARIRLADGAVAARGLRPGHRAPAGPQRPCRPRPARDARARGPLRRGGRRRSRARRRLPRQRDAAGARLMPIRVLLADDQAMVRAGFTMILGAVADIEVVGEAADGREAVAAVGRLRPDVVIMDIQMPALDGIAATREILARPGAGPRVLVVTTYDVDDYVYEALRAGASGFLLKNAPPEELVARRPDPGGGRRAARARGHPARHRPLRRAVRPAGRRCRRARRAHRSRARGLHARRPRALQRRDRRPARRLPRDRQDPRRPHPDEARPTRPHPGRRARLRDRHRPPRRRLAAP